MKNPARSDFTIIKRCVFFILFSWALSGCGLQSGSEKEAISSGRKVYNVLDYGAKGDAEACDTAAIQNAIDQCSTEGGGEVFFPEGTYLLGSVMIKDRVTLHLSDKTILLGSPKNEDYINPDPYKDGLNKERGWALIAAVDATNVGITGKGTIDGQGRYFTKNRPAILRFVRCKRVSVQGVRLQNSGFWVSHYFRCEDVTIDNVTIRSDVKGNNDGIDIDCCSRVTIQHCDVNTGDDAIVLKTTSPYPCRDVAIHRCSLKSNWAGIKFGTESMGDFENVRISDCRIYDTRGGGVKINAVDGAHVNNIAISNIAMDNVDMPLFLRLGLRQNVYRAGEEARPPGSMQNIRITGITATVPDKTRVSPAAAVFISGVADHHIQQCDLRKYPYLACRRWNPGAEPSTRSGTGKGLSGIHFVRCAAGVRYFLPPCRWAYNPQLPG